MRLQILCESKVPMRALVVEPATFLLVAQCLNGVRLSVMISRIKCQVQ